MSPCNVNTLNIHAIESGDQLRYGRKPYVAYWVNLLGYCNTAIQIGIVLDKS